MTYNVSQVADGKRTDEQVADDVEADIRLNEIAYGILGRGASLVRLQMVFRNPDGSASFIEMEPE